MKVRHVMQSQVATLGVNDALDIAEDIMTIGRIRHLPVVDEGRSLVGLVTQRDLLKASVASVLQLGRAAEHQWLGTIPVRAVMVTEPITIEPGADLGEALDLMLTRKFGCLPVVENGELVGLLTETDCLSYLRRLLRPLPIDALVS